MPNNVKNRITILGTPEQVSEVLEFLKGDPYEDGTPRLIDFNKIIPQPDNIFLESLGEKEREQCAREGRPNWYDWNTKNWGTKWGAYAIKPGEHNQVIFETAWSFPEPVAHALAARFPNVNMQWDYADEDTGCNAGRAKLEEGKLWIWSPPDNSKDAYDIAFDLDHANREDYEEVDGKYQYKEQ